MSPTAAAHARRRVKALRRPYTILDVFEEIDHSSHTLAAEDALAEWALRSADTFPGAPAAAPVDAIADSVLYARMAADAAGLEP